MPFLMRYPGRDPARIGESRHGAEHRFRADVPRLRRRARARRDAGPQLPPRNVEGHTPQDWRKSMYYRYWMHNTSDHHVPAHYGIRTDRWKLIYYYGKPLGMTGANPPDTQPDWELFDVRERPSGDAQSLPRSEIRGPGEETNRRVGRAPKRSRRRSGVVRGLRKNRSLWSPLVYQLPLDCATSRDQRKRFCHLRASTRSNTTRRRFAHKSAPPRARELRTRPRRDRSRPALPNRAPLEERLLFLLR